MAQLPIYPTREELNLALAEVKNFCEKHNETSSFRVNARPYEIELSSTPYYEVGLIIEESAGVSFNSFDIINYALELGLFCACTTFREARFGAVVGREPGMTRIFEGDTIATICKFIEKEDK